MIEDEGIVAIVARELQGSREIVRSNLLGMLKTKLSSEPELYHFLQVGYRVRVWVGGGFDEVGR